MEISTYLYPILSTAGSILATSATSEFAKSGGKAAFEAIKDRLVKKHRIEALAKIEDGSISADQINELKKDLDNSDIANDGEIYNLAERLLEAISRMDDASLSAATVAIDVEEIRAKGSQTFRNVAGIKADKIISNKDQVFEGINTGKS